MARAEGVATGSMAASNDTPGRWLSIVGLGENGREGLPAAALRLIDGAVLLAAAPASRPGGGWRAGVARMEKALP